mgnify:CR=1 FL=1
MTDRRHDGNHHAVEQIAQERDPGVACQPYQLRIVFRRRVHHKKFRRKYKNLIQRLERLQYRINKRQGHKRSKNEQD